MGPGHSLTQGSNFLTSCKNVGRNFFLTTFGNYLVSNAWHTNIQHLFPSIWRIYSTQLSCQIGSGFNCSCSLSTASEQLLRCCSFTVFWWMPIRISKNIWKYFQKNILPWGSGKRVLLIAPIMCGSFNPLSAFLMQLRSSFSAKSELFLYIVQMQIESKQRLIESRGKSKWMC